MVKQIYVFMRSNPQAQNAKIQLLENTFEPLFKIDSNELLTVCLPNQDYLTQIAPESIIRWGNCVG